MNSMSMRNKLGEIVKADEASANRAYANHTLLIVKGDYTYLPKGLVDNESNYVKKEDCYYAIPVGEKVTIDGRKR